MSASAITSRTAAAERASLGAVLGERNIWLLFVLGLGTGFPAAAYWINVFPRVDLAIDKAVLLAMTGFGITGWLALIAAPFLDRYRAPLFGSLRHRRSWVALVLATGLVVVALHLGAAAASQVAAARLAAFSGVLALLVWALLSISVDALRIDLYRGRSQAAAITAQYFGSLAAWTIATLPIRDWYYLAPAILCALLFAIGFGAVLLIKEPPPISGAEEARAPLFLGTLARPWSTFFARHGRASGFLLAAIAFYALAASAADFLGREGYLVDILRAARWQDADPDNDRALRAMGTQEIALSAIGALGGLFIAFKLLPARAFGVLLYAILGLLALFALCKSWLGFTVFTVAGLFALRTLIYGASFVIYATVAARLTARPDTAGHYALLALFGGLFWISESGFVSLAPLIGGYAMTAGAAVAAILAIILMRLAARAAKRAPTIDPG
jgi:hypothetical protein